MKSILDKRIGIVGGGQLGKMMILEAKRLGFYAVVLDPAADCPASCICDEVIVGSLYEPEGYFKLAKKVDVITYEWENICADSLSKLEEAGHYIYPSVSALKCIQNKYIQKKMLREAGILVPKLEKISNIDDMYAFGFPLMLKTASGGYDGKGVASAKSAVDAESAFAQLGGGKVDLFAEELINFEKEISVIACRGIDGVRVIYPVAENIHVNGILDTTIVPARIGADVENKAKKTAEKVMDVFAGVGTCCIELFVTDKGDVYVNEVAPRPHNSGHYTIEACFANQFENHIRAVTGLPLGNVELITPAVMVNLLGEDSGKAVVYGLKEAYLDPQVRVHVYGKSESKKGRKMGHFTVVDETVEGAVERAEKLKKVVKINI